MLQETETEGTIGFFVTFLSLVSFQLGECGGARLLGSSPVYAYAKVTQEFEIVEQQLFKLKKIKIVLFSDCPFPRHQPRSGVNLFAMSVPFGSPISPGSITTYECLPGYSLVNGSLIATCLDTGKWDGPSAECIQSMQK